MTSSTIYKLFYFNIRARGELPRMIFAAAHQPYQDIRISWNPQRKDMTDWAELKPKMPFGQLPVLEITEGHKTAQIAHTMTIARYLGRKFDLYGKTDLEHAYVDMFAEQLHDLMNEYYRARREEDPEKKEKFMHTLQYVTLPKDISFLEAQIVRNDTGYLVGKSLTWVDLYLFNCMEELKTMLETLISKTAAQEYSRPKDLGMQNYFQFIRTHKGITEWIKNRPRSSP